MHLVYHHHRLLHQEAAHKMHTNNTFTVSYKQGNT